MKANELMLGDFVRFKFTHPKLPQNIVEIFGIVFDSKVSKKHLVHIAFKDTGAIQYNYNPDVFEGVPLTPEILEKNGFVEIKDYDPYVYYLLNAGRFSISLEHCFDSFDNEDYWSCSISNRKSDATLSVHTIHELQHALRLCGIEKEIEL